MRKFLKISVVLFIFIVVTIGIIFEFGGYWVVDKTEREYLIKQAKSAPQLPDKFYELYDKIHANTIENHSHWKLLMNNLVTNNKRNSCPCNDVAYFSSYYWGLQKVLFVFHLERFVNQKECLNFLVEKYDFLYGCKGIKEASFFYYGRELSALTDKEMIELIVMMKNPSLFNKLRYPHRLEEEVNRIIYKKGLTL